MSSSAPTRFHGYTTGNSEIDALRNDNYNLFALVHTQGQHITSLQSNLQTAVQDHANQMMQATTTIESLNNSIMLKDQQIGSLGQEVGDVRSTFQDMLLQILHLKIQLAKSDKKVESLIEAGEKDQAAGEKGEDGRVEDQKLEDDAADVSLAVEVASLAVEAARGAEAGAEA